MTTAPLRPLNTKFFWLAVIGSLVMIAIGGRGLIDPLGSSESYGVPASLPIAASAWIIVAGIRDLTLGLLGLAFAGLRDRRALGVLALVSSLIPIVDGLVVLTHGPNSMPFILLHWGSAVVCLVFAFLLLR